MNGMETGWTCFVAALVGAAPALTSSPAAADTTLTVDLSTVERPATHVASGSLYGLIENRPANLDELLAPLNPKMFTNPAANIQQPWGDAIDVAVRVAPVVSRNSSRCHSCMICGAATDWNFGGAALLLAAA